MKKRPRQARSRALVDAVVEATVDLLSRNEGGEPPIAAIARRAGVGVGSIYDYFEGRHGILRAVHDRVTEDNFNAMVRKWRTYDDLPIEEAAARMLDEAVARHLGRPRLVRFSIRTFISLRGEELVMAQRDRFVGILAERLARERNLDVDVVQERLQWSVDMIMGVFVAEVLRTKHPRVERAREVSRDLLQRELTLFDATLEPPVRG